MAFTISWHSLNDLETLMYQLEALVDVTQDAILNDISGNKESISTALSIVAEKIRDADEIVQNVWFEGRQENTASKIEEESEEEDEEEFEEEDEPENKKDGRLGILDVEECEDGSFLLKGEPEDMERIMSAFVQQAIVTGIKSAENEVQHFLQLRKAAEDLERFLRVWEDSDEMNYSPDVKEKREALTQVLSLVPIN